LQLGPLLSLFKAFGRSKVVKRRKKAFDVT
jgi:hypothetical protein